MNDQKLVLARLINDYLTTKSDASVNALVTATSKKAHFYSGCLNSDHDSSLQVTKKAYLDLFKNLESLNDLNLFEELFNSFIRKQTIIQNDGFFSFDRNYYEDNSYRYVERNASDAVISDAEDNIRKRIIEVLNGLDPIEKMVSVMKYNDGMDLFRIAQELSLSENAVKGILAVSEDKISNRFNELKENGLAVSGNDVGYLAKMFAQLSKEPETKNNSTPSFNTINNISYDAADVQPYNNTTGAKILGLVVALAAVALIALFVFVGNKIGIVNIYRYYNNPVYYRNMVRTTYDSSDEISSTYEDKKDFRGYSISSKNDFNSYYYKYDYKYDTDGNNIGYRYVNTDKDTESIYKYDFIDGKQVRTTSYDEDGEVLSITTYKRRYGPGNRLTSSKTFIDGELSSEYRYRYDLKGNLVYRETLDSDGDISSVAEFEYDRRGNRIKEISYDADDNITSWYEYDYERNNQRKETRTYTSNGDLSFASYFENGLRTKSESYSGGELYSYTEYEYDRSGRSIHAETYNSSGDLTSYTDYEYDFRGRETYRCTCDSNDNVQYYSETEYR